ncbi:hypothetical protein SNE40_018361 [Patella caerulea]|uniref:Uncharacterized protein n=1 Tax=Patella caerulea TaxID=87958 RepID=A0AAN8PH30_PATCE
MGRGKTKKRLSRPSSSPYAQGRRAATDKRQRGQSRNDNGEKEAVSLDPLLSLLMADHSQWPFLNQRTLIQYLRPPAHST